MLCLHHQMKIVYDSKIIVLTYVYIKNCLQPKHTYNKTEIYGPKNVTENFYLHSKCIPTSKHILSYEII